MDRRESLSYKMHPLSEEDSVVWMKVTGVGEPSGTTVFCYERRDGTRYRKEITHSGRDPVKMQVKHVEEGKTKMKSQCFNVCLTEIDIEKEPHLRVPSPDGKAPVVYCLRCAVLYARDELSEEDWWAMGDMMLRRAGEPPGVLQDWRKPDEP